MKFSIGTALYITDQMCKSCKQRVRCSWQRPGNIPWDKVWDRYCPLDNSNHEGTPHLSYHQMGLAKRLLWYSSNLRKKSTLYLQDQRILTIWIYKVITNCHIFTYSENERCNQCLWHVRVFSPSFALFCCVFVAFFTCIHKVLFYESLLFSTIKKFHRITK